MSNIKDQKISEFLESVSSKSPTPGGGAVAAVVGAMAASLVEMVCNLTKDNSLENAKEKASALRFRLLDLADQDSKAFEEVMAAFKSKDKQEIKKTLLEAIRIPSKTKEASGQVEKLAEEVLITGNKNAVSDAKTAIHLSRAAQKSAQENVDINKEAIAKLVI